MVTASNDENYNYKDSNEFFEYWSGLAKTDPERFEIERKAEIEKVIQSANPENEKKLRHLQWKIDMERRKAKNPIDSMVRLNKMMWNQFYDEKEGFLFATKQLQGVCYKMQEMVKELNNKNAEIIPFKRN